MKINKKKIKNIKESLMKNSKVLISTVVLLILLVAATIAWYVLQNTATITPFKDTLEPFEFIVTSVDEANPNEASARTFAVTPAAFDNVKNGKMAPGTYGSTEIFIRSNLADSYSVYLDDSELYLYIPVKDENGDNTLSLIDENVEYKGNNGQTLEVDKSKIKIPSNENAPAVDGEVSGNMQEQSGGSGEQGELGDALEEKVEVYDFTYLINKHFRFFVYVEEKDENDQVQYVKEEFTSENPYEGVLDKECNNATLIADGYKKDNVKVYWEWLYDAYDYLIKVEDGGSDYYALPESNDDGNITQDEYLTQEQLDAYELAWDYEDNFISKYVGYMKGSIVFTVTGSQVKPTEVGNDAAGHSLRGEDVEYNTDDTETEDENSDNDELIIEDQDVINNEEEPLVEDVDGNESLDGND